MGLNLNGKKCHSVFIFCFILIFLRTQPVFPSDSAAPQEIIKKQFSDKTLVLKIKQDISLDNLISNAGYTLDDRNMNLFLTEFINLNKDIKSISLLKKGTILRLPLKHLERKEVSAGKVSASPSVHRVKKKIIRKNEIAKTPVDVVSFDRSLLIRNFKTLFQSLEDNVTVDAEGLKIFNISDRSELSLDKSFFPSIDLHNEHILVFDYSGILPEDLKNLLEISWPEYRFVSYKKGMNLKNLVYALLNETGYAIKNSQKLVVGGRSQIEYYPDFLVFRKNDDFMDSEISLVSIIDYNEMKTPASLVNWLNKKGIRVVELSNHDLKQSRNMTTKTTYIDSDSSYNEFAEKILTLLGYDFSRDKTIHISNRKEFTYNLKADLSINLGYKTKVIEFNELSDHEVNYAKKQGLDISCISPWEEKREIAKKIMTLFSLEFSNMPKTTSLYITPKKVRYRLFLPGVYAKSRKGGFFLTDSELENDLLESILDEKVAIVKY